MAYDALVEDEGKAIVFLPMNNFTNNNLDNIYDMLTHADTLIGLGDGGAHYCLICDAIFPTLMLTYWTRDRDGAPLTIPAAVDMMTRRGKVTYRDGALTGALPGRVFRPSIGAPAAAA